MWFSSTPIWKAPPSISEPRRRRTVKRPAPEDEAEPRPEFDFSSTPNSYQLARKDERAARKIVTVLYYLAVLVIVLPFAVILGFFVIGCFLAFWMGIFS